MKKHNLQTYMWDGYFKQKYAMLPFGRRDAHTIQELKKLIIEMRTAGYPAAAIGRFLDKDHTTILHHLKTTTKFKRVGVDPVIKVQLEKEKLERVVERNLIREKIEKLRQERSDLLKKRVQKKRAEVLKRHINFLAKQKATAILRAKVFARYKAGDSYTSIARQFGIAHSHIQALLVYHPEYRSVVRPRSVNLAKSVVQLSKEGKPIKTYSTTIAAAKAIGIARSNITLVCKGRIPSAGGYLWKYAEQHHG